MFFRKNQTSEQAEFSRQIITFILIQGVIFSSLLFISRLTEIDYNLLLIIVGTVISMMIIPSNLELNAYAKSAQSMAGHKHQEALKQILKMRLGWRESLERFAIGLIPFCAGIILTII